MAKIENLANLVKAYMVKWEALKPEDIDNDAQDRFEQLEIDMAILVEIWYREAKEELKDMGGHSLGIKKEIFKDIVHKAAEILRGSAELREADLQLDESPDEIARAIIPYEAAKLYEYAKSVKRSKL